MSEDEWLTKARADHLAELNAAIAIERQHAADQRRWNAAEFEVIFAQNDDELSRLWRRAWESRDFFLWHAAWDCWLRRTAT